MLQTTLAIIKPEAVAGGLAGEILAAVEAAGLRLVGLKMLRLNKEQAQNFYAVHRERPFFDRLTDYMASGPVICMALQGEDAVARYRELMGATDPAKAAPGTLRHKFAQSLESNAVHGSDCPQNAAVELCYFFNTLEILE